MSKGLKTIYVLIICLSILLGICIYQCIDFYNDYKCSTTTDTKWFTTNNCMRYMK